MRFGLPLLAACCCLVSFSGFSATYYIDAATGRDTAAGTTPATAWRTLSRVNERVLVPGDNVLLRRGGVWREKLYVDDSGTAAQPITFGAYGTGATPVLNGANLVSGWLVQGLNLYAASLASAPEIVFINGAVATRRDSLLQLLNPGDWTFLAGQLILFSLGSPANVEAVSRQYLTDAAQVDHVILRDLAFEKAADPVRLFGASNTRLERLEIRSCFGYSGILLSGFGAGRGQNNVIRDCVIEGMRGTLESKSHANNGTGIFVWGLATCRDNLIENCTLTGNGNSGILLIDTASNVITDNTVLDNGSGGIVVSGLDATGNIIEHNDVSGNCQTENDCFGINLYRAGSDNSVRYNTVYGQHVFTDEEVGIPGFTERSGGIRFDGDLNIGVTTTTGNAIYGNLIHDEYEGVQIFNYSNVTVYNNTIYNVTRSGMYIGSYVALNTAEGNRVFSNIIHSAGQQFIWSLNAATTVLNNNVYYPDASGKFNWNGQRSNFSGWKTRSGQDGNSLAADPRFVSAGAGDFRLSVGSPAIDRGIAAPAAPIDMLGIARPQGAAMDSGAYEYAILPSASFTATPQFGGEPLFVQFTDTSSAGTTTITAWSWDFDGDGIEDSSARHPGHTYTASGEYPVRLRITTSLGQFESIVPSFINVTSGPNAAFSATPLRGIAPLNVTFADLSSPGSVPIAAWAWDFDNNGTTDSTLRNPAHVFPVGRHSVRLTVTDSGGEQNSHLATDYIVADTLPQAAFSANVTTGFAPLAVQFTDLSQPGSEAITAWAWDFGDSASSTLRHPLHTYSATGPFTVRLTVTTNAGSHTYTATNLITTQATLGPTAAFNGTPRTGLAPLEVSFQDESSPGSYAISAWHWDFGDGTTSNEQHPSHTYGNSGTYAVSLNVTTMRGTDAQIAPAYVTVSAPVGPAADFTAMPAAGRAPLPVQFNDRSEPGALPITAWNWSFGDGNTSTVQHPSHTYVAPGSYPVSLQVTTGIGSDTRVHLGLVRVYGVVYVDAGNASGVEDGTSWTNAFTTLQPGIDEAAGLGGGEVWVAEGSYDEHRENADGALLLRSNVSVYGGFVGVESARHERNWTAHPSVIDGVQSRAGNPAYHVVIGANNAVLDGFYIQGGRATLGSGEDDRGAGLYNNGVAPRIVNCLFRDNEASRAGAALYNTGGAAPQVLNCRFSLNNAAGSFLSQGYGGAVYNDNSSPVFVNCVFEGNTARAALFSDGLGGAIYNRNASPSLMNCTLSGNRTYGALFSNGNGGGIYNENATPVVTNTILWDNFPNEIRNANSTPLVNWSVVEGGHAGVGNVNSNPLFTNAGNGDYTLMPASPALDTGTATGAPGDDLRGVLRPQGPGIDRGAYEDFSPPAASFTATPLTGTAPLEVTFVDTSTSGSGPIAAWRWDFGDGTTSSIASPQHTYNTAGTFVVTMTVNPGSAEDVSEAVEIVVAPGLAFTAHPVSRYAYEGDAVYFEVGVGDGHSCTFQWWFARDDQKVAISPNGNTPVLALGGVAIAQAGEYWCEVTDGQSNLESERASLFVAAPLSITGQPVDAAVPQEKSHTFSVGVTGGFEPLHYAWFKNGDPVAEGDGPALTISGVQPDDAGMYHLEVLDNFTSAVASEEAMLHVTAALPMLGGGALGFLAALLAIAGSASLAKTPRRG